MTLKHVQTVRRGDHVWRYLRLPGQPRVKLPDLPADHPDFLAAYIAALKAAPKITRARAGTIAATIESLYRSAVFTGNSAGYQKILRRHLDAIREQAEDAQIRHLRAEDIQDDLEPLAPVAARDRMKAWRMLCGFALTSKSIRLDPTEAVRRPTSPVLIGHDPWTPEQIEAYRNRWGIGTVQRAIMEILYWTGARRSDAAVLGPGMVDRLGVLTYRQQKTGDEAYVPWRCPLPAHAAHGEEDRQMMHDALAAISTGHMTYLATRQGRTRSSNSMGNLIASATAAAGFDRSAHGLRKSRAIWLADARATPHQIGAWTGHQSLAEIAHYTKKADRKRAVMGAPEFTAKSASD